MTTNSRTLAVCGLIISMIVATPLTTAHAQPPARRLQSVLDSALTGFPARVGVYVKHLTTGEEAASHADDTFNTASVIKLPVLVLAMQMADQQTISLAERVTITAADIRGGTGVFRYHDAGLQPTWRDVLLQMIITSDNTATDLAISKVGGVAKVNAWLADNGYGNDIKLGMTTGDLFKKYAAIPNATSNDKTNNDRSYWLGEMTPRATGRMLEAMQRCSDGTGSAAPIASKANCVDMIRMMRAQQAGARRVPHFLTVAVAHKTGDFPPVLANDVGIIYTRSGPVVVAFFANAIEGPFAEAEDRIGRVAQRLVEYFDAAKR